MSWRDDVENMQDVLLDRYEETDADGDTEVLYEPNGGTATAIRGIFRDEHAELEVGLEVAISTEDPTLDVLVSELALLGMTLPVDPLDRFFIPRTSTRYRVTDHQRDGEGMVRLILSISKQ